MPRYPLLIPKLLGLMVASSMNGCVVPHSSVESAGAETPSAVLATQRLRIERVDGMPLAPCDGCVLELAPGSHEIEVRYAEQEGTAQSAIETSAKSTSSALLSPSEQPRLRSTNTYRVNLRLEAGRGYVLLGRKTLDVDGLQVEALESTTGRAIPSVTVALCDSCQSPSPGVIARARVPDPFIARFTLGLGYAWLAKQVAREARAGSAGDHVDFGFGLDFSELVTSSVRFGSTFPDDLAPFTETLIDSEGVVSEGTSGVTVSSWAVSAGLRSPPLCLSCNPRLDAGVYGFARLGIADVSMQRQVGCVDCVPEQLHLQGGMFVETGADFGFKLRDSLGLSVFVEFRQHLGGGEVRDLVGGLGISNF